MYLEYEYVVILYTTDISIFSYSSCKCMFPPVLRKIFGLNPVIEGQLLEEVFVTQFYSKKSFSDTANHLIRLVVYIEMR